MQNPPKFSSFRPKAKPGASAPISPTPPTPAEYTPRESRALREASKRQRAHHHEDHSEHTRSGSRHQSRSSDKVKPTAQQLLSVEIEPNNLFLIDRRGDPENTRYGTNNKYSVPVYRPSLEYKTLGNLSVRFGGGNSRSILSSLSRQDRKALQQDQKYVGPQFLPTDALASLAQDFLPIRATYKRHVLGKPHPAGLIDHGNHQEHQNFAENRSPTTSDESEDDETEEEGVTQNAAALKVEHARLSHLTKTQSRNAQSWLDYIAFQKAWMQQERPSNETVSDAKEDRGLADIRLSIYQKALDAVPKGQPGYEKLLLGMLREAELVLEHVKTSSKWQKVVSGDMKSKSLEIEYINFRQSSLRSFNFERCRDLINQYIMLASLNVSEQSYQAYLYLRLTRFLNDAGYHEIAVALWQAALELNCCSSVDNMKNAGESTKRLIADFEEFWERERPRIGEEGAQGWSKMSLASNPTDVIKDQAATVPRRSIDDQYTRWHDKETRVMNNAEMPGRTTDDGADSDPYRVTLFSDIKPFLQIWTLAEPSVDLINAFLTFNNMPMVPDEESTALRSIITYDGFLANAVRVPDAVNTQSDYVNKEDRQAAPTSHRGFRISHQITTVDSLFAPCSDDDSPFASLRGNQTKRDFLSRTLQLLVGLYPAWTSLAEYYIGFEYQTGSPAIAKKLVKELLKSRSSNLRLYNAYALTEARSGNAAAADKVFQTAITMSPSLGTNSGGQDVIILWRTWIWLAMEAGCNDLAVQRLMTLGGYPAYSQSAVDEKHAYDGAIIGITELLSRELGIAFSRFRTFIAMTAIELLALLRYLTHDPTARSLSTTLAAYSQAFSALPQSFLTRGAALETLHQHRARLIAHHITTSHNYRPVEIRLALEESIALFPANTTFLQLYHKIERRNRIDDRVRELTRKILHASTVPPPLHNVNSEIDKLIPIWANRDIFNPNPADNPTTHFFTIASEMSRGVLGGSTRHSVRAAFERAAASHACRHSSALWTSWVDYESALLDSLGPSQASTSRKADSNKHQKRDQEDERQAKEYEQQMQKVKEVYFRGFRHLPWVKNYAMLALGPLRRRGVLGSEECAAIHGGMLAKGLRVSVELEQ